MLNLVDTNPGERLTDTELWDFVSEFTASILEKKQFVITTVPKKVERAFAALRTGTL